MLTNIWNESWSLRQAVRFVLNGYDYGMVAKMAMMTIRELKYKRKH